MKRRSAITAIPLAIAGLTAAKGNLGDVSQNKGVLDERALSYALQLVVEASTSGICCSFLAFVQHISALAKAGDSKAVHALAERLTDALYEEHHVYDESRETWLSEELSLYAVVVDMDDDNLSDAARQHAFNKADIQHARRRGNA